MKQQRRLTGLREVPQGFQENLLAYLKGERIDLVREAIKEFSPRDALALGKFKGQAISALEEARSSRPRLQVLGDALAVCMYDKQMELAEHLSDLVLEYGHYLLAVPLS